MKLAIHLFGFTVPVLLLLAGCGSSPSSGIGSGTPLTSGGATSIYVIQNTSTGTNNSILQFPASSNGTVSPSSTLLPPAAMNVGALATDSSGQIYVAGTISGQYEVLVYAAGASGSATPLRTIIENAANVVIPNSLAVDSAGAVYVLGPSSLGVFAANANGTSSPIRLIQGALTQLNSPNEVTVDGTGNIYVTAGAILIFASGATGNVAPTRVITTAIPFSTFTGIAVDSASNIYMTENTSIVNPLTGGISTAATLVEFSSGASGAATPTKSVSGSATGLTLAGGLSRDNAGNIYILNVFIPTTGSATFNVLGFSPNATGNVGPGINFNSSAWTDPGEQIALK